MKYFAQKERGDLDVGNWRVRVWHEEKKIPMQKNYVDCGVFACMFASAIVLDTNVAFDQTNINRLR